MLKYLICLQPFSSILQDGWEDGLSTEKTDVLAKQGGEGSSDNPTRSAFFLVSQV